MAEPVSGELRGGVAVLEHPAVRAWFAYGPGR